MLFSELYKIMVNKVTFVDFRGKATAPIAPFGSALVQTAFSHARSLLKGQIYWICSVNLLEGGNQCQRAKTNLNFQRETLLTVNIYWHEATKKQKS